MPINQRSSDLLGLVDQARINLSDFINAQARMRRERLGFGWQLSPKAPSNYAVLRREFKCCASSGLPLRVSDQHNDLVIYDSPTTNGAMRFLHDSGHVIFDLSFDLDDELELSGHHLEAIRAEGLGPDTIEYQLLHADTFGQTYFQLVTGRFVGNQLRFDTDCVLFGVEAAVVQEFAALRAGR